MYSSKPNDLKFDRRCQRGQRYKTAASSDYNLSSQRHNHSHSLKQSKTRIYIHVIFNTLPVVCKSLMDCANNR